jgi:hypothetical protein
MDTNFLKHLHWVSTEPILTAHSNPHDQDVSIKDPSAVFYGGRWHVYATSYVLKRAVPHMVYTSFFNWDEADAAPRQWIDFDEEEHCAPQVFFFRPQQKWYLIYQRSDLVTKEYGPVFSTMENVDRPDTLTQPCWLFPQIPSILPDKKWLDFWVICDDSRAFLFFTNNRGQFYRSETGLADFPYGWNEPVLLMSGTIHDLFEASCTYRLKGTGKYLTLIEAVAAQGRGRYYKAWLADRLDGEWIPVAATEDQPFASISNVTFAVGHSPWTDSISHGELLREGYDETMTVDPTRLSLLYQGHDPHDNIVLPAGEIRAYRHVPYKIGLLEEINHVRSFKDYSPLMDDDTGAE